MTVGPVAKLYCVTKQRQNRSLRSWVAAEYPRRTVCVITVTCIDISVLFSQCASRNVREHISVNVCFSMHLLWSRLSLSLPHACRTQWKLVQRAWFSFPACCVNMTVGLHQKTWDTERCMIIWHARAKNIKKKHTHKTRAQNTKRIPSLSTLDTHPQKCVRPKSHSDTNCVHCAIFLTHTSIPLHSFLSSLPFCAKPPVRLSSSPILTLCGCTVASVWRNWLQSHYWPQCEVE